MSLSLRIAGNCSSASIGKKNLHCPMVLIDGGNFPSFFLGRSVLWWRMSRFGRLQDDGCLCGVVGRRTKLLIGLHLAV